MTETMKDLFERTLVGEPAHPVLAEEDVARGRSRQRRVRRTRAAGGVALLAVAGLGAAVLPAVFDDADDADAVAPAEDYPVEVGGDPIRQQIWDAVESALPAGVEVYEDPEADPETQGWPTVGPGISLNLQRGEAESDWATGFSFTVVVEPTLSDLPEYRPCSEPGLLEGTASQWRNCTEGRGDDGVWRAAGDHEYHQSMLLAENDDVSVSVTWSTQLYPLGHKTLTAAEVQALDPDEQLAFNDQLDELPTGPTLTRAEAEAVREAVLAAMSGVDPADLTTGVELQAVADAWPQVEALLEEQVGGELTPVRLAEASDPPRTLPLPSVDVQDAEHQVGTIHASYVTEDGAEIDLWFWQRPRVSEPMCLDSIMQCSSITGGQELLGPAEGVGSSGESGTPIGLRGDTWIRVHSPDTNSELPGSLTAGVLQPLHELLTSLVQYPFQGG